MTNEIVVITGPESCGKTTLARQLADRWRAPLVSEAARDYLQGKDSYQKSDLLEIAKLQYAMERERAASSPGKLVCVDVIYHLSIFSVPFRPTFDSNGLSGRRPNLNIC